MKEDPDRRHRLEEVIASYLKAVDAGSAPDRAALLAAHPDLAEELHQFFLNRGETAPSGSFPAPFGPYQLLQELGRGGMGVVFKARDERVGRTVALKMLIGGRLASKEDRERFRTEVEATASLDHPLIVPIYDVGDVDGQPFFTTKFMEGGSVDAHLEHYGRNPWEAAALVATVARSIHHAHRHGLLHRDLKPANILLDDDRRPHLTDFGLALRVDAKRRLTSDGIVIGTVNYMAPEQAAGEKRLTTAVDLYALGAILYELLTGRVPFDGQTPAETLRLVLDRDPAPPRAINPEVDGDLERICMKCLEKEPGRRYGSAEALSEDLERWIQGKPVEARPVGPASRAWRWCRRNPGFATLYAAVAALALLLGGGAAVELVRENTRRDERLRAGADLAKLAADRVLVRFEEWADVVWRKAADPEFVRAMEERRKASDPAERRRIESGIADSLRDFREGFQNWHLLDERGAMIVRTTTSRAAHAPETPILGTDFSRRDYFAGTRSHLGMKDRASVHISAVYSSVADGLDKYDIGAPVVSPGGEFLGVLAVAVTTDRDLKLPPGLDERWTFALAGPRDPSPPHPPVSRDASQFMIVAHPLVGLKANAAGIDHPLLEGLAMRDCRSELTPRRPTPVLDTLEDYEDPVYRTRGWMAGVAPVGKTGFVVIVSQRR